MWAWSKFSHAIVSPGPLNLQYLPKPMWATAYFDLDYLLRVTGSGNETSTEVVHQDGGGGVSIYPEISCNGSTISLEAATNMCMHNKNERVIV